MLAMWTAAPAVQVLAAGIGATPFDAERLVRFMERIGGLHLADQTFAQWMLDNSDPASRERLAGLLAASETWTSERFEHEIRPDGALGKFADVALRLCFTGKAEVNGRIVFVDYLQALAWRAAGIKPGTYCDPAGFGGWAKPPEAL